MIEISKLVKGVIIGATALFTSMYFTALSLAQNQFIEDAQQGVQDTGGADGSVDGLLQTIVNVLLFLVGSVSAIMIVVGGLRFVLSRGDPQQAASARNTVLYSAVGLVVAVLAWAIVNWVLGELYGTGSTVG